MVAKLTQAEAVVLTLIGKQTKRWFDSGTSEEVAEAARAHGYSAEDVELAISLLIGKRYVKVSHGHLLQLTAHGYYRYAEANISEFQTLREFVELAISKNPRTNNRDAAKILEADQVSIDYIFDMLCQDGTIDNGHGGMPLASGGPLWHIMKLSPEFTLKYNPPANEAFRSPAPVTHRFEARDSVKITDRITTGDQRAPSVDQPIVTKKEVLDVPAAQAGKPRVFVGSSKEGLKVAHAVHARLDDDAEVTVWDQGAFALSKTTIESLVEIVENSEFGIFVLTPEDMTTIRGQDHLTVRDNVIFELGLFIGALARDRCFILRPKNLMNPQDFHLPTDLLGITAATYDPNRSDGNMNAAVTPACGSILSSMEKAKPLNRTRT